MNEFEIYFPSKQKDGKPVDSKVLDDAKATLKESFGGYTCVAHKNEGAWKLGGASFLDAITIVRVLDDGSTGFDMVAFRSKLEARLNQNSLLIVKRSVEVI